MPEEKQSLISASVGLNRYKDKYYLCVISDDNYKFYFVPITLQLFVALQLAENLSVQHLEAEPAEIQD